MQSNQSINQVDPLKVSSLSSLESHRKRLTQLVEATWSRVLQSSAVIPLQLRLIFAELRADMQRQGCPDSQVGGVDRMQ